MLLGAEVSLSEQLAKDLHQRAIKKFLKIKVCARYKGYIRPAYLAEIESLSPENKNFKYLLCVIVVSLICMG